jgi:hypothetical protein
MNVVGDIRHVLRRLFTDEKQPARRLILPVAVACALVLGLLYLRAPGQYRHPSFWSEDGSIFFTEAQTTPLRSLATPYAGYLQVAVRLGAVLGSLFPPQLAPVVYLAVTVAYTYLLVAVIWLVFPTLGIAKKLFLSCATVLASINPYDFNNLTNSQWQLGAALALLLLWEPPADGRSARPVALIILLAGLQGPFSVVYCPILALRALLRRDLRTHRLYYGAWLSTVAIQLFVLFQSPRVYSAQAQGPVLAYAVHAVFRAATGLWGNFGGRPFLSGALLAVLVMLIYHRLRHPGPTAETARPLYASLLLGLTSLLILIPAIISIGDSPLASNPRYLYIPSFLLTCIFIILTRNIYQLAITAALLIIAQVNSFASFSMPDLQWQSYLRAGDALGQLQVPINPQLQAYPGRFDAQYKPRYVSPKGIEQLIEISGDRITTEPTNGNAGTSMSPAALRLIDRTNDPQTPYVTYQLSGINRSVTTVVFAFAVQQPDPGWIDFYYGDHNNFPPEKRIIRYFPTGTGIHYFAFPVNNSTIYIHYGILAATPATVSNVKVFLLY